MSSSRRDGSAPSDRPRAVGDRLVDRWCGLDRGWQAVLLGLGIVGVRLFVQAV